MAETVHRILDSFTPSLHCLLRLNLFTTPEIASIVARRTKSEYLMARRVPRLSDMIHYVEEELMLEQLHQIRRRKVFDSNSSDSAHGSVDRRDRFEGAGLILKHIHFIYGRMCRKFGRKERSVWFSYIEFCKGHTDISKVGNDSDSDSDSETTNPNPSPSFDNHNISGRKLLSKLYAEALQLHPLTAAFWIEAASFEAFSKGNFDSARSILQRAVRVNRNHAANMRIIWVEMVKLECGFVEVTNGRREFAKKRKRLPDESDKDDAGDLTVPLIVLKNAVNHARSSSSSSSSSHTADSNNIAFYASLLQIVSNQFKHLDTTSILTNFVTNALTTDFHSSPKAVLVRADFERSVNNDLAAFSVLMDGIEACRGSNNLALSEMLRLSAEFIWDCLVDMNDKDVVVVKDVKKVESMYKKLLVDASKEAVGGGFDSRLCLLLMEFYRDVEEDEGKAKSVAEQFLKGGGVVGVRIGGGHMRICVKTRNRKLRCFKRELNC